MIYEYNGKEIKGLNVLFFYSAWSKSCVINEQIIKDIGKSINVIKVNTTKYYELKERYNVKKIPTYILVSNDRIISKYSGLINSKSIYEWIRNNVR